MDLFNIMSLESGMTFFGALFVELFLSIHMSAFLLYPLANMLTKDEKPWKLFWKLFVIRIIILMILNTFNPNIAITCDTMLIFAGAFVIVPIVSGITKKSAYGIKKTRSIVPALTESTKPIEIKAIMCPGCGSIVQNDDKFCQTCGKELPKQKPIETTTPVQVIKKIVKPTDFDGMFSLTESDMVEEFLQKEMERSQIDVKSKLIPSNILRRKRVLNIIFCVLLFIFISMIFFHFPILTYIIGFILLLILFIYNKKFNIFKYLVKEMKSRPNEKVSNIVMQTKMDLVPNTSRKALIIGIIIAIILPLIIFFNPRIIYEKVDGGYAVRYYIYGLTNYTTATIPKKYNGENVVSLRGNTFSNMFFLEEVNLPDTITEIRGQAFKNCISLKKVNIPSKLEYLGGGAFQNAISIESIVLPDTLTELGGEAFSGAKNLKSITLSDNLTEIRGNTFEDCTSLKEITIPDKVTRIGGHAFHGDRKLEKVNISRNSNLREIGSSAFRECYSLGKITIPKFTYVNERAFKNSGTYVERFGSANLEEDSIETYETNKTILDNIPNNDNNNKTNNDTNDTTPNIKPEFKEIVSQYSSETMDYGNKVTFTKYNMVVNYEDYNQDNIAWFTFDYNGISRKISYDLNSGYTQYYAFDNYTFYIKKSYNTKVLVMVFEMVPTANKYDYYINLTLYKDDPSIYLIKSKYINNQIIKTKDIRINSNGDFSLDAEFIGDINKTITFSNTNYNYTTENLEMVIHNAYENSITGVIYLK